MPSLSRTRQSAALRFLNLLYRTHVRDAHCGMRALRSDVLPSSHLRTDGDGVRLRDGDPRRAGQLDIRELPIELHPRGGESKLSPFRDGWRHLRLMLVYSPTFLFIVPGVVMLLGSIITCSSSATCRLRPLLFVHTLIAGCLLS